MFSNRQKKRSSGGAIASFFAVNPAPSLKSSPYRDLFEGQSLVRLRQGFGATRCCAQLGPIYVSAKRTHRFSERKQHLSNRATSTYPGKIPAKSVGSFCKTNPPGGVFWWGSVAATTTSRHLVGLGLENEPTGGVFFGGVRGKLGSFGEKRGGHRGGREDAAAVALRAMVDRSAAALRAMADRMADGEDFENMCFCETNPNCLASKTAFIRQDYKELCDEK
jgi:hypothetical protein